VKVLISAYACEPGRGSEPGIGWNTAREMAARHDVWVITRGHDGTSDQRRGIERELAVRPVPGLRVAYYDLPAWIRRLAGEQGSSYLWQIGAYRLARRLHASIDFDLGHHVSWVRYYTPTFLAFLRIPYIWGPVGGGESMPAGFRRSISSRGRRSELQRRVLGIVARLDPLVRLSARNSTLALANGEEMARRLRALGARSVRVFGESGVDPWVLEQGRSPRTLRPGGATFASMTRLVHWKGVHLGIGAFARLADVDADARYWVIGDGPERTRLESLARELGVADRVEFHADLSRAEWMERLRTADALVHPCVYNSGGAISLEAMALGTPVICLARGGIRDQVTGEAGYPIPADDDDEAITGLAAAMRRIVQDREAAAAKGAVARARVARLFTWEQRALVLDAFYRAVAFGRRPPTASAILMDTTTGSG
jgi:glycosyltransferase involved in cell wall biosynthesis